MEKDIQAAVIRHLNKLGHYNVKVITASKNGVADVLACIGGRFVALEIKQPGRKLTPLQEANFKQIKRSGGAAFRIESTADLIATLRILDLIHY